MAVDTTIKVKSYNQQAHHLVEALASAEGARQVLLESKRMGEAGTPAHTVAQTVYESKLARVRVWLDAVIRDVAGTEITEHTLKYPHAEA